MFNTELNCEFWTICDCIGFLIIWEICGNCIWFTLDNCCKLFKLAWLIWFGNGEFEYLATIPYGIIAKLLED